MTAATTPGLAATPGLAPTLAVALGDPCPNLPTDSRWLVESYLKHAILGHRTDPTSRAVRQTYLPQEFSRARYSAALRALVDRGLYRPTQRQDGSRHVLVSVPTAPDRLLAAHQPAHSIAIQTDAEGWPDHRQFLADLDSIGVIQPGARLRIDLGDAVTWHWWTIDTIRQGIREGRIPRPEFHSRRPEVQRAWARCTLEG